eukprot:TRINITY_DN486_c0_g1_i4.p1 TRINITY_DN486_c0_g1~~TRINITY_DN486_c0_g1_i4.p1  ORF type:complete len:324 (-),score=153.60 TRINITY_DN486_c0_g1_i4:53-1024(-)
MATTASNNIINKNETIKNETIKNETIKNETIKNETIKNETIKNETIKNETIKNETIKNETQQLQSENIANSQLIPSIIEENWPMTSDKQIERLTRPGSAYFNLNHFEVLGLSADSTHEEIKKKFRKLSLLIHPDKNPQNEKAQIAFDTISKAYQCLQDSATLTFCREVVVEARKRVEEERKEKKIKAKKQSQELNLDESDIIIEQEVRIMTLKLFAEAEKRRQRTSELEAAERKRKREAELQKMEESKREAELQKEWELGRDARVNDWRNFCQKGPKGKKQVDVNKRIRIGFRPPTLKVETRPINKFHSGSSAIIDTTQPEQT